MVEAGSPARIVQSSKPQRMSPTPNQISAARILGNAADSGGENNRCLTSGLDHLPLNWTMNARLQPLSEAES